MHIGYCGNFFFWNANYIETLNNRPPIGEAECRIRFYSVQKCHDENFVTF